MMSRKISLKKFENNPMSLHKKWQYLNAITKVVENIEFSASFLPEKIPPKKIIIYIMLNSGLVTEVATIARSPLVALFWDVVCECIVSQCGESNLTCETRPYSGGKM